MALSALTLACGCETKGFMDPTEMAGFKKDPLVLPIVSQIDPGIEEADNQWARATNPTADDLKPVSGDYHISPNDLLAISLSDINGPNTETVKQTRVTESGNISLPYLEKPLHVAGLTEAELEQMIVQAYKDANLIQHAQVSVTVVEARGRAFSILGAVAATGEYAIIESDFRMLNALVQARNITSPFVDYIYVIRRLDKPGSNRTTAPAGAGHVPPPTTGPSSEELAPKSEANSPADTVASAAVSESRVVHLAAVPEQGDKPVMAADGIPAAPAAFEGFKDPAPEQNVRIIRIPYQGLRAGDLKYNITIHPKDVIYVADPQTGFYYVGGHVARPGAYTLTGQKMTLKDAIISASMLDGLAIPQRTEIIRHINPAHEVFVRVDLAKIFAGEEPDVYLKPNDKIMVGTNALAPFLAAIRGGFRISYGFGFLFDRNYAYSTNGTPAF
jgi:protein involved in polysaccharide export with SLBB domain